MSDRNWHFSQHRSGKGKHWSVDCPHGKLKKNCGDCRG